MKKASKSKIKPAAPRIDPYLEGFMNKLLERFVALEKKMDAVLVQTAVKVTGSGEVKPPQRQERTLYEAICADCHKICEVPFRPSEARPVYCKECFAKRKSGSSGHGNLPAGRQVPVLTPVVLPPKPVSKLGAPSMSVSPPSKTLKKASKSKPNKKMKK